MSLALTPEQRATITKLKALSKAARKAPWDYGGQPRKDGAYAVYRLHKPEEDLIIAMRNHIDELIKMVEEKYEDTSTTRIQGSHIT